MNAPYSFRTAVPDDFDAIIAVADAWWGRPVADALPRLFLDHFFASTIVETPTEMGFTVRGPIAGYHRPGTAHVVFERRIGA